MNNSALNSLLRKLVPLIILFAAVLGIIYIADLLLVRPSINVTAPSGSTINVFAVSNGKLVSTQQTSGSSTIRVDPGDYKVTLDSSGSKQLYYISLAAFGSKDLSFKAPSTYLPSLVARQTAYGVLRQGNAIEYLDTADNAVVGMGSSGNRTTTLNNSDFADVQTVNRGAAYSLNQTAGNEAIAQISGRLYLVKNSQLSPLNTDGIPGSIGSVVVGTNPGQISFAAVFNNTLYWYQSAGSAPRKIIDLPKTVDELAIGNNKVIAYSTRMPESSDNIKSAYSAFAIDPILVDIQAKTQTIMTNGPIVDASISPDDTYALLVPQNSSYASIYSLANNRALYNVESPTTVKNLWIDSSHFVYAQHNDIWNLNVSDRSADLIGSITDPGGVTSVTYNSADDQYFATAYAGTDKAAIYGLTKNPLDQNSTLAASLVASQNNPIFTLSYVNISGPAVIVSTNVIGSHQTPSDLANLDQQAHQAALSYLQQGGLDINKINIVYTPTGPSQ